MDKKTPPQDRATGSNWVADVWNRESPVIKGAKYSFAVCVLIVGGALSVATYWFVDHLYSAARAADAATIENITTQRDDYKAKAESKDTDNSKQIEQLAQLSKRLDEVGLNTGTLPKYDPRVSGALWNNGGVICVSESNDVLLQPIASVTATVLISADSNKVAEGVYDGDLQWLSVLKGDMPMLSASSSEFRADGKGNYRVVFTFPVDNEFMGKPIRFLESSESLRLEFPNDFVPLKTHITGGQIIFVINNQTTLKFKIPAQDVSLPIGNTDTLLIITDLKEGLAPLSTQPSSIPEMSGTSH